MKAHSSFTQLGGKLRREKGLKKIELEYARRGKRRNCDKTTLASSTEFQLRIQGMVARKEFYLFELWSVRAVTDVISSTRAILLHTLYLKLNGKMICINGGPKHCQYMRKKVILMVILFQYIGHVKRVADSRLSKQFPSGLLKMGILTAHEQKKCFKDTVDTHSNNVENLALIQILCSIVQSTVSR